jgi:hypothetical protein
MSTEIRDSVRHNERGCQERRTCHQAVRQRTRACATDHHSTRALVLSLISRNVDSRVWHQLSPLKGEWVLGEGEEMDIRFKQDGDMSAQGGGDRKKGRSTIQDGTKTGRGKGTHPLVRLLVEDLLGLRQQLVQPRLHLPSAPPHARTVLSCSFFEMSS